MKKQQKNNSISSALHGLYRKALKHTKYRWIVILGTLLYLVSPLDIAPDAFPIIGWIDDGLIVSLLITEVGQMMSEQLKRKGRFNSTDTIAQTTQVETVIDTEDVKTINVEAVVVS